MKRPKHAELAEILREKAHELTTGSRLPSVRSLMDRYNLSLYSVNSALDSLEKEGVVERRPWSGI